VVTEVAGRGIGMDIVRDAVNRLGATLAVTSDAGRGTAFELAMPLSVSAVEAVVLMGSGCIASIPVHAVRTTLRLGPGDVVRTPLGETILYDGESVPLVPLTRLLGAPPGRRGAGQSAVVVASSAGLAAISVDRIAGVESTVVRALPELASATTVIAGASLDEGGNPLLMLDPEGVVAAALGAGEVPEEEAQQKRPLLVIDDSLTTRMLEQSILESAGYEVDVATSGEEGLERARGSQYALILVDVEMPGMDGFTFIEHIRRDQKLRDIPAILVTSRNAPEDKRRGREVGAQDYVVKSEFDQAALLERIRELVA
jgi:two-component system chemotaxis sensor kinase CheA